MTRDRIDDACDFVVVGSGAAGATAALVLAEAGRDVIVLEEGPRVRDEDRGLGPTESFMRLFRDRGTQVAMGRSVIPDPAGTVPRRNDRRQRRDRLAPP